MNEQQGARQKGESKYIDFVRGGDNIDSAERERGREGIKYMNADGKNGRSGKIPINLYAA